MRWGCSGRSDILQAGAARQAGLPALSWAAFGPWKPASPPRRGGLARREGRRNLLRGRHRGTGRGRANEASPASPKKPGREENPPFARGFSPQLPAGGGHFASTSVSLSCVTWDSIPSSMLRGIGMDEDKNIQLGPSNKNNVVVHI